MSEQQFGWNYFENEVVIGDKQDKKRMIVLVFSNFMDIPYNRKYIDELVDLLNEQQATIEELRLQEKDKGVPVFVVREGKNPIALFFNEQRASLYCQENMANLTYQQEKWCRVE